MTYNDPTVGHVMQVCLPYSPSVLPREMSSGELEGEQSPWYQRSLFTIEDGREVHENVLFIDNLTLKSFSVSLYSAFLYSHFYIECHEAIPHTTTAPSTRVIRSNVPLISLSHSTKLHSFGDQ